MCHKSLPFLPDIPLQLPAMRRSRRVRRVVNITSTERMQVTFHEQPESGEVPAPIAGASGQQLVAAGQWLIGVAALAGQESFRDELIAIGMRLIAIGLTQG
jgi:hypothetical protein